MAGGSCLLHSQNTSVLVIRNQLWWHYVAKNTFAPVALMPKRASLEAWNSAFLAAKVNQSRPTTTLKRRPTPGSAILRYLPCKLSSLAPPPLLEVGLCGTYKHLHQSDLNVGSQCCQMTLLYARLSSTTVSLVGCLCPSEPQMSFWSQIQALWGAANQHFHRELAFHAPLMCL